MVIIVDDVREAISLCGLSTPQFFQLCAIIRLARRLSQSHIAAVATALHTSSHWILAERPGWATTITLAHLSWEEVFVLQAYIAECQGHAEGDGYLTEQILEGLDAAVESALRPNRPLLPPSRFNEFWMDR